MHGHSLISTHDGQARVYSYSVMNGVSAQNGTCSGTASVDIDLGGQSDAPAQAAATTSTTLVGMHAESEDEPWLGPLSLGVAACHQFSYIGLAQDEDAQAPLETPVVSLGTRIVSHRPSVRMRMRACPNVFARLSARKRLFSPVNHCGHGPSHKRYAPPQMGPPHAQASNFKQGP